MKKRLANILFGCWIFEQHILLSPVTGFPDGAGGCEGGVAAAGGSHLDSSKTILAATLFEGGIAVFVGDTQLEPSRTDEFPIGQDLPIQVVAQAVSGDPVAFKGVLIRVEAPDGVPDAFNAIIAAENTQQASVCEAPVGGITHFNRDEKTVASGTIRFDEEVLGVTLDISVVFLNEATASAYAYTRFTTNFRATTPISAPVTAPVLAPVTAPVAGPTNPPTPIGTGTPQPTPFNMTASPSTGFLPTLSPTITNAPSVPLDTDSPTTPLSTPQPSPGKIATDAPTPYGTYYPPPNGKGKGGNLRPPHYPGGKGKGKGKGRHSKKSKGSKGKGKGGKSKSSSSSSDEYYHHHYPRPHGYGYILKNFFGNDYDDNDGDYGGMTRGQRNQLRLQLTGRYAYNRNREERWDGD
jgi:hypothetical protein